MSGWKHPNRRSMSELPPALRRAPVPEQAREWICRRTGSRVVSVRRLPGASSTAVHAVRLADGRVLVLRRYAWEQFRVDEPEAPAREVDALRYARRHHLPVPAEVAADPGGDEVGDGTPAVLMGRVAGRALAAPDVEALAGLLARVHSVNDSGFEHRYGPWCRDTSTVPPPACRHPALWEQALEVWRSAEPAYEACFIHRDFHPGNVLWLRRGVAGVVDWVNGCIGPPGIDVATCRWNLQGLGGGAGGHRVRRGLRAVDGKASPPVLGRRQDRRGRLGPHRRARARMGGRAAARPGAAAPPRPPEL